MRTPVLLLLDSLLSQDASGTRSTLERMREELPPSVKATYLPHTIGSERQTRPVLDQGVIVQHLSVYLQTFPQQAAVASPNDGSLPLHFAASFGDAVLAQVVWQAVSFCPSGGAYLATRTLAVPLSSHVPLPFPCKIIGYFFSSFFFILKIITLTSVSSRRHDTQRQGQDTPPLRGTRRQDSRGELFPAGRSPHGRHGVEKG